MGSFTLLMHKGSKVAHVYFCLFFFSQRVCHYFFLYCRDVMWGSLPFAELFHALAVSSDECNFSPNAFGSEYAAVVTEAKGKKNCIFQRQLKHEILMSTANPPPPCRIHIFHFGSQWDTFLNRKEKI